MNKNKKNTLIEKIINILKRLSPCIVFCFIPYCLNMGGVVTWRNENSLKGHIRHLVAIIIASLDNDEVLAGFRLALDEFIFNFTSIGSWIKFIIFLMIPIVLLKIIIALLPHLPTMIKTIISAGRTTSRFLRNIKRKTEKIKVFESIEYSLRYHLIPTYSVHNSIICISTVIDDMKFLGGVKADNVKFPKLHLISFTGEETDCLLDKPISIIKSSSGVFLCGHGLIDENETTQRKIKLSHEIQVITIGKHTFEVYIEER